MKGNQIPFRFQRRRGIIFVTALGIIVILTALVLAFAVNMRSAAQASANRISYQQADAIELGAEQWVSAQVNLYQTAAVSITQVPAAGLQVGSGYFWILQANPQNDQQYQFGITDESSKLNLNSATAAELMALPATIPQNVADAILDWRNPVNQASPDGAESATYNNLQPSSDAYNCKNLPYETVEELLLVSGVTPQLLFGYDLNRNGIIEPAEIAAANGTSISVNTPTNNDSRGIFNYLTVYSTRPATPAGPRAPAISGVGRINVNTAPAQVLMCLPGMNQSTAQAIVSAQSSNATATNTSWVNNVVGQNIFALIAPFITSTSYQYSADIVAVSGDGRAFKRVRIVLDCQQLPVKIIYRKDLTSLGWPLPQEVQDSLRAGKGIPADFVFTSNTPGQLVGNQSTTP